MRLLSPPRKIGFALYKLLCKAVYRIDHRTYMKLYLPLLRWRGVKLNGTPRYIGVHTAFDDYRKVEIGDRVTISDECHLLTHDYSITNAFRAVGKELPADIAIIRGIRIGNNVFIGKKSILMPDCTIGDNCIVGAGAVVRGHIPENSLVIGNPGKVVGSVTALAEKWETLDPRLIRKDS
ncbi:acyltransferase [uncultured Alistipes sp.]|uniref:acyltransferase n=1 Tax=uncultured Alistipes sp. TaxID=538949 RepID=UPI0032B22BF9